MVSGGLEQDAAFEGGDLYGQLRAMAWRLLRRERSDHTLQPTALVHEAYLRLRGTAQGRELAPNEVRRLAAATMRRVLVDHARRRNAARRWGTAERVPLDRALALYEGRSRDLVALDEALARLAEEDHQLAAIVDLRFFGGFTAGETAQILGVCERTVVRGWRFARLWLHRQLETEEA